MRSASYGFILVTVQTSSATGDLTLIQQNKFYYYYLRPNCDIIFELLQEKFDKATILFDGLFLDSPLR